MTDLRPRFSLLFADPDTPPEALYSPETVAFLGTLSADDTVDRTVKAVLCKKTARKDITFRKEILEDFRQTPSLLTKCETVLAQWEGLYEVANREENPADGADLTAALTVLKTNTLSLLEHLKFLRVAAGELAGETPKSQGLFAFAEFLRQHAASTTVKHLFEALSAYPLLREEGLQPILHLNAAPNGTVLSADLRYLGTDPNGFRKKYPGEKEDFYADLPSEDNGQTVSALCRTALKFRQVTATLREAFLPLKEGLVFYHYALSVTEWASEKGFPCLFPSPLGEGAPFGRRIRHMTELAEEAPAPADLQNLPLEGFGGTDGMALLQLIARTQILAGAGLPLLAEECTFCPEARVVLYDSQGKTTEEEVAALAEIFRETRPKDILLLHNPLCTPGTMPEKEMLHNLLSAFYKKGAVIRIAANWSDKEAL